MVAHPKPQAQTPHTKHSPLQQHSPRDKSQAAKITVFCKPWPRHAPELSILHRDSVELVFMSIRHQLLQKPCHYDQTRRSKHCNSRAANLSLLSPARPRSSSMQLTGSQSLLGPMSDLGNCPYRSAPATTTQVQGPNLAPQARIEP